MMDTVKSEPPVAPVLDLQDVTKRFGSFREPIWALTGVSLEIKKGETVGLVGESGSGKSTIARIASGLDVPTTGSASIMGKRAGSREATGLVQLVFQDPASSLDPLIRIRRSIREPLEVTRVGRPDEIVDTVLKEVGLGTDYGDRFPAALSGGQKQRASIARSLSVNPPLIVCDEAVTALDVSIRAQILNLLRRVQGEYGASCLFISHDLCTVAYMSDRIVVLYLGAVMEAGYREQIFSAPAHPYTFALLSAVPQLQQGSFRRAKMRLRGDPPSVINPPSGCRFHTRCPLADERCRSEVPLLRTLAPGHTVACHYAPVEEAKVVAASRLETAA